ncbi:MAG: glycoside hydrolase family 88 protein [Clostridia bacterium]|nr:glycoside hydrolase family 88 protein [Clostridia bacterium]
MNAHEAIKYLLAAAKRVKDNLKDFYDCFPGSQSNDYVYVAWPATNWTEGFWTGMNMLSYEFTKDKEYLPAIEAQLAYFKDRAEKRTALEHHDLGFLYSTSCVAKYKVDGDRSARETALKAADILCDRFREKGGFLQAWGKTERAEDYRLIIDCLMNIPLLFWAYMETGEGKYKRLAMSHLDISLKTVIREDYTTHHTYYFDIDTGEPLYGKTAQGYSDDSCWARGQAWGVYGTALAYKYTKNPALEEIFNHLTDVFISKLPSDYVPYWDMIFTDGSGEERDTSAAAIAVCGILEMNKYFPNKKYTDIAHKMMESLSTKYNISEKEGTNAILSDAMYSKPAGHKAEANIWGDYFYMEALMRMVNPDWKIYW